VRTISGGHPPPKLAEWKRAETVYGQRRYEMLPTVVKEQIRDQRVRDQHGLCAYTLRRIRLVGPKNARGWDAHVEHVVTQRSSRERGAMEETVDYDNMVACVDRTASLPYGAAARGDTVEDLPVTPFHPSCAVRFRYHADGRMDGVDGGARRTLEILRLNHASLVEHRRAALAGCGIGVPRVATPRVKRAPARIALSQAEATRRAKAMRTPDADGNLPEFCEVLAQCYEAYAELVERRRRAADFARRGGD
jgi:uncharacterized protein (TIGR02646 family)